MTSKYDNKVDIAAPSIPIIGIKTKFKHIFKISAIIQIILKNITFFVNRNGYENMVLIPKNKCAIETIMVVIAPFSAISLLDNNNNTSSENRIAPEQKIIERLIKSDKDSLKWTFTS